MTDTPVTPVAKPAASRMEQDLKDARSKGPGPVTPSKTDSEVILDMMNKILSKEDIEQKSRQIFENIKGICQVEVLVEALVNGTVFLQIESYDGFQFLDPADLDEIPELARLPEFQNREKRRAIISSVMKLCDTFTTRLVSLDGLGRQEMIELAKAFSIQIQQHQHEQDLAGKLIGMPRGPGR